MRLRMFATIGLLLTLAAGVPQAKPQEKLALTSPVSQGSIDDYQVQFIGISRESWSITVELKANAPGVATIRCTWAATALRCSNGFVDLSAPGGFADARAMIVALNKANLSSNSLEKRVYTQLITDGAFVGSVTGSPE